MPHVCLDEAGILPLVHEGVPARVADHVRMRRVDPGFHGVAFHQVGNPLAGEGVAPLPEFASMRREIRLR